MDILSWPTKTGLTHNQPHPPPTTTRHTHTCLSKVSSGSHCAFWNFGTIIRKIHHALDLSPLLPLLSLPFLHFSYCQPYGTYLRNLLPLRFPVCPQGVCMGGRGTNRCVSGSLPLLQTPKTQTLISHHQTLPLPADQSAITCL